MIMIIIDTIRKYECSIIQILIILVILLKRGTAKGERAKGYLLKSLKSGSKVT